MEEKNSLKSIDFSVCISCCLDRHFQLLYLKILRRNFWREKYWDLKERIYEKVQVVEKVVDYIAVGPVVEEGFDIDNFAAAAAAFIS